MESTCSKVPLSHLCGEDVICCIPHMKSYVVFAIMLCKEAISLTLPDLSRGYTT